MVIATRSISVGLGCTTGFIPFYARLGRFPCDRSVSRFFQRASLRVSLLDLCTADIFSTIPVFSEHHLARFLFFTFSCDEDRVFYAVVLSNELP